MRLGGHKTPVFLLLCSSDVDDIDGRFFGFLVNVDAGDENIGVAVDVRSIFCIAIVLLFFGDDVIPVRFCSVIGVDGDANILLFNKGHP